MICHDQGFNTLGQSCYVCLVSISIKGRVFPQILSSLSISSILTEPAYTSLPSKPEPLVKMRFSLSLLLPLVVAPFAAALTIPEDASEGFFVAYYDADGQQVHVKNPTQDEIADMATKAYPPPGTNTTSAETTSVEISKRAQRTWCGCGFNRTYQQEPQLQVKKRLTSRRRLTRNVLVDHGNCDTAVAGLKSQLGNGASIGGYLSYYVISGSVVAFACNSQWYGSSSTDSSTYAAWLVEITDACGWYVAGTFNGWGYLNSGYMNWYSGLDFCGAALGSSKSSC